MSHGAARGLALILPVYTIMFCGHSIAQVGQSKISQPAVSQPAAPAVISQPGATPASTQPSIADAPRMANAPPPPLLGAPAQFQLLGSPAITFTWSPGNGTPAATYFELCVYPDGSRCSDALAARYTQIPAGARAFAPPGGLPAKLQGKKLRWTLSACSPGMRTSALTGAAGVACSSSLERQIALALSAPQAMAPLAKAAMPSMLPPLQASSVAGAEKYLFCVSRPNVSCPTQPTNNANTVVVQAAPANAAAQQPVWPGALVQFRSQPVNWVAAACNAAVGCTWGEPRAVRLEPSVYSFDDWLGFAMRSSKCVGCHGMSSGNDVLQRHRTRSPNPLPSDADVTSPALCAACHTTQAGYRDACTISNNAEAAARCAQGIAPNWRAAPASLRLPGNTAADRCSLASRWVGRGASPAEVLSSSRALLREDAVHVWAISQLPAPLDREFGLLFDQWVTSAIPFRGNGAYNCTNTAHVGAEWGEDGWESKVAGADVPWNTLSPDPTSDQLRQSYSRPESIVFLDATGGYACRYEWTYLPEPKFFRFNDMRGCDNDEAVSARIEARAGTVISVFDNPDGRTDDDFVDIRIGVDTPLSGDSYVILSFERNVSDPASPFQMVYRGNADLDGAVSSVRIAPGTSDAQRAQRWLSQRPAAPREFTAAAKCPPGGFMTGIRFADNVVLCSEAWSRRTIGNYNSPPQTDYQDLVPLRSGLTACEPGKVMLSANPFACGYVRVRVGDFLSRHIDTSTQRAGMRACPPGEPLVGFNAANDELVCRETRRRVAQ